MGVFRRQWPGVSYGRGEDWHYVGEVGEPAFENNWVGVSGSTALAFRIRELGVVDVVGAIDGGSATGDRVFTLPAGYRPSVKSAPLMSDVSAVTIRTDGSVEVLDHAATSMYGYFYLTPPALA